MHRKYPCHSIRKRFNFILPKTNRPPPPDTSKLLHYLACPLSCRQVITKTKRGGNNPSKRFCHCRNLASRLSNHYENFERISSFILINSNKCVSEWSCNFICSSLHFNWTLKNRLFLRSSFFYFLFDIVYSQI